MINVGIADDHSLFREGIRMIIDSMEGVQLTLEAESGKDLINQLKITTADVILLDIEMKDMNGIETLKTVSMQNPKPKIIVLSMHTEPRMISYMMEQDANGYLPKDVKRDELELAIRTVYEKGMYLNEMVSKSLLAGLKNKNRKSMPSMQLSSREKEILELICQEYTMQEIGEKLFISERTVEGHRKNICLKLDVKNTAGLVRKAVILNLVDISLT
ncbi:response regulator transcription factor [Xanthocytophaga agilis]|uniref:Response regulator transcription factor n=1 Tax=Xanthocytophaga agilis TaxID=3048010 RepID=A0AAE3R9U2_9BACT|nr:response regulator transcription factor [Xanthocytophaga agilis]MDJ1506576.1 response regulator transcription factor [Xanthocytophaga agilis]